MIPRFFFLLAHLVLLPGLFAPKSASAEDAKVRASFKEAFTLARAGKLVEAEQPLNRLLAETNDAAIPTSEVLTFRAYLRADNGRFQNAADDLERVIELDPSDHVSYFLLTPLLIQIGKIDEYRNYCHSMLRRFNDTTNAPVAERTAKCCLLLPAAVTGSDLALAAKIADHSVALAKTGEWKPWRLMTKGLAEYRQGHFARAAETLELAQKEVTHARDAGRYCCEADIYFVSAMAHQQLKQPEEARTAFGHGRVLVQVKLPAVDKGNLGIAWPDVLMTYILMQEAAMTAEKSPDPNPK